ncbi:uncharacterized protein LOC122665953 [Telopea speciosissima]|uniref:uncharacterized protein LOC122665953 n=1 Tax=Telopea speciosissima TaxID=54955 RepID=UPI001CC3C384|nr:uncharacterized protein LOC122665953 [Telopea speciosissima]
MGHSLIGVFFPVLLFSWSCIQCVLSLFFTDKNELETDENNQMSFSLVNKIQWDSAEGHADIADNMVKSVDVNYDLWPTDGFSSYGLMNDDLGFGNECKKKLIVHREFLGLVHTPMFQHSFLDTKMDADIPRPTRITECEPDLRPVLLSNVMENFMLEDNTQREELDLSGINFTLASCPEVQRQCNASAAGVVTQVNHPCAAAVSRPVEGANEAPFLGQQELQNVSLIFDQFFCQM